MEMDNSLDFYLIKAVKDGLLDLEHGRIVFTEKGEKTYNEIQYTCFLIMEGSNETKDFITSAAKILGMNSGEELFSSMLLAMLGSKYLTMAFLLNEQDNNYKYLKTALVDDMNAMMPPKPQGGPSVVKK